MQEKVIAVIDSLKQQNNAEAVNWIWYYDKAWLNINNAIIM